MKHVIKKKFTILNTLYFVLTTLYLVLSTFSSFSQNVTVKASLDTNSILIGQQTKLVLSVSYSSDQGDVKVLWPVLNDTIGTNHIEIVKKSSVDTSIADKSAANYELVQSQILFITSFDSGYYAIPPLKFIINGDSLHPKETESLLLQVSNIPVDTTKAIRDIKPPLAVPYNWLDVLKEYLPTIGLTILGVAIIIAIIYFLQKYTKEKPVEVVEEVKIPEHIIALQELEKLKEQKLWQEGKIKQYHSAISEIIRAYIERRYNINALEQTTDEIMQSFRSIVIDKESKEKLKRLLLLSDLVKFAKEEPLSNENEMSLINAFEFVNGTSREVEPIDNNQSTNNLSNTN